MCCVLLFCIIGNFDKFPIIQKALRAGCARRNKEILPLCGIAAARKVDKFLKSEGQGGEVGLSTLFYKNLRSLFLSVLIIEHSNLCAVA